jgi:Excalibur calcium-binding domain
VGNLLALLGVVGLVVSLVGLVRGHVGWARLASRKASAVALLGSLVVTGIGAELSPQQTTRANSPAVPSPSAATFSPTPGPSSVPASSPSTPSAGTSPTPTQVSVAPPVLTEPPTSPAEAAPPPAVAAPATSAPPPAAALPPAAGTGFANCTALRQEYPHGVGRPGAVDHTSGKPVTTFTQSAALYQANAGLDRDGDGIACEAA